jgi:OmcA/MtrC family decaheme c-type cytochrome
MQKYYQAAMRAPWVLLVVLSLIGAAQGTSRVMVDRGMVKRDLAAILDPGIADLVRPSVVFNIVSVTITGQTVAVHFTIQDSAGLPLDRLGVDTAGTVSTSFVMGYIPNGQSPYSQPLYSNYFLNTVTATTGGATATQPTGDSGGTYTTNADGDYIYTFGKQLPAGFDPTVTNTVAMYGSRNLTAYGLLTYYSNAEYSFVPNGSKVTVTRQIVANAACNQCHDPLSAHGGSRQDTALCILCHQPQNVDPNTGNNLDFTTMIHKIHMGASLPTTVAGGQYEVVGFGGAVSNFSTVVFPQYVGTCTVCHQQAPQATAYLNKPSRRACGACHDDVNFATGVNHGPAALPQADDSQCATCHVPSTGVEFDASITGAHVNPLFSAQLPGTTYKMISVTGGAAGKSPTVTFSINDAKGNIIPPSTMTSLSLVMSGPTTDYGQLQNGTAAYLSETATGATASGNNWVYTFTGKVPAGATGSYAIGIEGYRNITISPNTPNSQVVRDSGSPQVIYFSVDGSPVAPRRTVVTEANCDTCHGTLNAHGGFRRNVQYCILCHNPNGTDAPTRPAAQAPNETIHFKELIHKIHNSANLTSTYTIYGFGGSVNNFNSVLFPGNTQDCVKCHASGTQEVPLPNGVQPTVTPREWINPTTQPMTAACTACHDGKSTSAHALVNTDPVLGESCAICHSPGAAFAVDTVHVP